MKPGHAWENQELFVCIELNIDVSFIGLYEYMINRKSHHIVI